MSLSLDHVGIVASHPPRSIDFYACLLAGTVETRAGHTVVSSGSVKLAIVARTANDPDRFARGHHLALRVPLGEREDVLARLQRLGARHEEAGGRLYVLDPDGFVIELLFGPDE